MLPSNLLVVWKRKGKIYPRFKRKTSNNLKSSQDIIEIYKKNIGQKKQVIKEQINEFEEHNYRFIRGLSVLLERRSIFKTRSSFDPKILRREVFKVTGILGSATTLKKRKKILNEISKKLGLSINDIEGNLYADLDNELILESIDYPSPEELLESYNLSLTQTLLFDSIDLEFTTMSNWQKIFYRAKKLGLIYEAYKDGDLWIKIDGPNSVFKLTRRYGSSISKLLPSILKSPNWKIKAKILWKYTNEIYSFTIDSLNHKDLFRIGTETLAYDSIVEADFGSRFQALKSKWIIKREPEPLIVGKHVMIPDFSFERDKLKIYLEVVGFWTTDYLLRKIEKLEKINVKMIVAVDESLACEALSKLKSRSLIKLLYFKKRISLSSVLNFLNDEYKKIRVKQFAFMKKFKINFTEPVVDFEEFASRISVSVEVIREVVNQTPPEGYIIYPKGLLKKEKTEKIKQKINQRLNSQKSIPLSEVNSILAKEGINATSVLSSIGYKIIWHGIDYKNAEVIKQVAK